MTLPWTKIAGICALAIAALSILRGAEDPEERIKKLVVMIQGKLGDTDTIGAGVIFGTGSDRLYIATANHVVRHGGQQVENPRVQLRWLPGEAVPATLTTHSDATLDLAVLTVQGLNKIGFTPQVLPFDQLGDAGALKRQDASHSLGFPNATPWALPVSEDRIARASVDSIGFESPFLFPGNSGGALLNGRYELIGIVRKDEPPNGDAANINRVIEKLKEWSYPVALRRSPAANPVAPVGADQPDLRTITVWKVGSPYTGNMPGAGVPELLERQAEKNGYKLRVEAFPAMGFAEKYKSAVARHQEPEILAFDNFGIIEGSTTPLGTFEGIGMDRLVMVSELFRELQTPERGWEFLVSSAINYPVARSLVLREPQCRADWVGLKPAGEFRRLAATAASAYISGSEISGDTDRLRTPPPRRSLQRVHFATACGYWGNERLAFVPTVTTMESEQVIGQKSVLLVFSNTGEGWKPIGASTDEHSTGTFLRQMPALQESLAGNRKVAAPPAPATLLAPPDGQAPAPAAGTRFGNYTWIPSASEDVVAEIAEFAQGNDARFLLKLRAKANRKEELVSRGSLYSGVQWKWRVWSISSTGAVAFSETRSTR